MNSGQSQGGSSQGVSLLVVVLTGLVASALLSGLALLVGGERIPPVPPSGLRLSDLHPSLRPFRPGERLAYAFDWNGIPGARAQMGLKEQVKDGIRWLLLQYEGQTADEIAWAWRYRVSGEAYLDPQTLLPAVSIVTSTKGDRTKRSTTRFDRAAAMAETVTEKLYRNTRSTERQPFRHGLDLPTALLFLRTLELRLGQSLVMEVLHRDGAYAVTLTPRGTETVQVKAGRFEAIVVDVRARSLGADEPWPQYQAVRIWISARGRVPLKMEALVPVGRVRAELVSLEQQ